MTASLFPLRPRTSPALVVLLSVLAGAGCGSSGLVYLDEPGATDDTPTPTPAKPAPTPTTRPTTPPTATPPPPPPPRPTGVSYGSCPSGYDAGECGTFEAPLDWSKPEGQKISVQIARTLSGAKNAPQLWLLQGGPGGSADDMTRLFEMISSLKSDVDLYTIDHRGVGKSARLGCPKAESSASPGGTSIVDAELAGCAAEVKATWGAAANQFTTTAAARDLAAAIALTKTAGQDVFVYGVSYGTYWAHRYLQVASDPPAGVILDSVVPAEGQYMSEFETQFDPAAKRLAGLCAKDAACAQRLGTDPWARMSAALRAHKAGACPGAGSHASLRAALSALLQNNDTSAYVVAALYRLERCSPADVAALKHLASLVEGESQGPQGELLSSDALYYNVVFGELWPTPSPTRAELVATVDRMLIGNGGAVSLRDAFDVWPHYPQDRYVRAWATAPVPMLMLNGDLDVQTPIESAETVTAHFKRPDQVFVKVPNANHGVIVQSEVKGSRVPCGMNLILQFVTSPTKPMDKACALAVAPPDFANNQASGFVFGTSSMWSLPVFGERKALEIPPKNYDLIRAFSRRRPTVRL